MSDPILTPKQVRNERYRYPDSTTEDGANDVIALGDSHEALRSRLAESEAERERMQGQIGDRDDYIVDLIRDAARTEAALAEAVELLRDMSAPWDLAPVKVEPESVVGRARAFIEAHG